MRVVRPGFLCAAAVALVGVPHSAAGTECHVDTAHQSEVRFLSDAPIEDFEGTTSRIDGYAYWPGDSLALGDAYDSSEIYFEVPLYALRTGIDMRDRHMRENYLHTDRYPYVSYKGRIERVDQGAGDTLLVSSSGTLELHGEHKDYEIVCHVVAHKADYGVTATFEINLTDFDIEVPSLMFMKVSEVVQVSVDFHVAPVEQPHAP